MASRPPPDAREPSTELDDPPLQFFLEHQEQLLQWLELAPRVHDAVAATLQTIELNVSADERVAAFGISIGDSVLGEAASGPVLFRQGWRISNITAPDVGICLGWEGRVDPSDIWPRATPPYTGILTSHESEVGRAIEAVLRRLSSATLGGGSGSPHPRVRTGSNWIVYRPIRSEPDWWRDIPGWRQRLVNQLFDDWQLWADHVEQAVVGLEGGASHHK